MSTQVSVLQIVLPFSNGKGFSTPLSRYYVKDTKNTKHSDFYTNHLLVEN